MSRPRCLDSSPVALKRSRALGSHVTYLLSPQPEGSITTGELWDGGLLPVPTPHISVPSKSLSYSILMEGIE